MNLVQKHISQQQELLQLEFLHEKKEYEELCRKTGINKRIRQGKCLFPISLGRCMYNALDQLVVEISWTTADDEKSALGSQDNEFEPGKPISFFHTEPVNEETNSNTKFLPFACQVNKIGNQAMTITLPSMQALDTLQDFAQRGQLGIQIAFDATSFRVMREALQCILQTDDPKLIHLRDTLIGTLAPSFRTNYTPAFPWLNTSQEEAVKKVLNAREVAIVHGPPGTGKTTTLIEAIGETLNRETQVMVSAQSNAAVDWICEQLSARGIPVLRIGNPMRVSDALLNLTYERRYEAHPEYTELWCLRKAIRGIKSRRSKNASKSERMKAEQELYKLTNRATEIEIRIHDSIFDSARVIACTLIGTASKYLERKHFSTLFIDEAAQAMEAACWSAITKADRVIFAGDHKQLPATIKCKEAEQQGLGYTLMERIAKSKPECVNLLTIQYRMNEVIMKFPSQWFYGGRLQASPEVANRTIFPMDDPLVWIDTTALGFEEEQNPINQSRLNRAEGELLVIALKYYIENIGVERIEQEHIDIGIISPYKSQVLLLRKLIAQNKELKPVLPHITVHTVDGFQGQERDIVFISMVRGNDEGRIGFLNDLRRMNVAITRAKMKLIVLGDANTLSHVTFYKRFIDYTKKHGSFIALNTEKENPEDEPVEDAEDTTEAVESSK